MWRRCAWSPRSRNRQRARAHSRKQQAAAAAGGSADEPLKDILTWLPMQLNGRIEELLPHSAVTDATSAMTQSQRRTNAVAFDKTPSPMFDMGAMVTRACQVTSSCPRPAAYPRPPQARQAIDIALTLDQAQPSLQLIAAAALQPLRQGMVVDLPSMLCRPRRATSR